VLLGNAAAGGIGIDEFKVADTVIYISNSCDTEQRKQSEDRTHRIGSEQHEKITYYDIIVPNTVDVKIVQVMRRDGSVSAEIMRDGINQWI
jgi:SNF2 family DNA or RNA helicase